MIEHPVICKPITVKCVDEMSYCFISSTIELAEGDNFYIINSNRSWDSVKTILEIRPQKHSHIASIDSIFDYFPALEQLFILNSLSEVPSMQFSAQSLRLVNFRKNSIRIIKNAAFVGAVNLEHIDLTENLIHSIENGAFNGLEHLISIRMMNNKLGSLQNHTFNGAKSLSYINLRNNSIATIADGCFALKNLEELSLAENHLEMVSSGIFNGSERLKKVSLAHNRIKVINIIALIQSAPIEILSFEDNELFRYEKQSINCTTKLNYHLKHLNLANNQLENMHIFDSLNCLSNLEMLNLNRNNFTQFNNVDKLKIYFPHLTIIHLIENKINCTWLNQTPFDTSCFYSRPNRKPSVHQIACIP